MTQGGKKMTQVYHSFFPSLRRNHNENMLLLLEGDIWYPEVYRYTLPLLAEAHVQPHFRPYWEISNQDLCHHLYSARAELLPGPPY